MAAVTSCGRWGPNITGMTNKTPSTTPTVLTTVGELRAALVEASNNRMRPVVLVPTMGALHDGHLSLVKRAQAVDGAVVVVSIFVNPLQFAAGEDLEAYPRTLAADVEKLAEVGADFVFAPNAATMYPAGPRTVVQPGPVGAILEGKTRPTHFAGVLTVVNKLFNITKATHAVFGEKDYQQLLIIRQMVEDNNLDIVIIGAPIVREASGLAKSSRNAYLTPDQTDLAAALSASLRAGAALSGVQLADADRVVAAARAVIDAQPDIDLDYLELRSADLGQPTVGENRLLVAARVGNTRLIDNCAVELS